MKYRILHGHVLDMLRTLPDESVQCIVTSPPYWGLRDYKLKPIIWSNGLALCTKHRWKVALKKAGNGKTTGEMNKYTLNPSSATRRPQASAFCSQCNAWKGQLGLEPTPELYVEHLVQIFQEARRVLRSDGTLWLNMGDSYGGSQNGRNDHLERSPKDRNIHLKYQGQSPKTSSGIKQKDLVGIPWMVAFALRKDGWYLRSDNIWHKPNPMPESVRDRPTRAHDYVFLLSKSAKYYYDAVAINEPASGNAHARGNGLNPKALKAAGRNSRIFINRDPNHSRIKQNPSFSGAISGLVSSKNRRTVWCIASRPFKGAHFATFPPELPELLIKAGTSEKGCCEKCGAPRERIVRRIRESDGRIRLGLRHHVGYAISRLDHRGKYR